MNLTTESKKLLVEIIEDLPNWGDMVLSGGNVDIGPSRRGNLSDLVKKGLVEVYNDIDDNSSWIKVTDLGMKEVKN